MYNVKAYNWVDGNFKLAEFANGFTHRQALEWFRRWSNSNAFAKVEMTKMELV
jgi:hypothetical protein